MANDLDRCYETLGLRPGASPREVRRSYIELTKVWHPDRFTDDPRLKKRAEAQLRKINGAYERLCAAYEARAAKQLAERPAERPGEAAAAAVLARLPMPEIMALLIFVAVLAVLTVVVVACRQLTSGPAALLAAGLV